MEAMVAPLQEQADQAQRHCAEAIVAAERAAAAKVAAVERTLTSAALENEAAADAAAAEAAAAAVAGSAARREKMAAELDNWMAEAASVTEVAVEQRAMLASKDEALQNAEKMIAAATAQVRLLEVEMPDPLKPPPSQIADERRLAADDLRDEHAAVVRIHQAAVAEMKRQLAARARDVGRLEAMVTTANDGAAAAEARCAGAAEAEAAARAEVRRIDDRLLTQERMHNEYVRTHDRELRRKEDELRRTAQDFQEAAEEAQGIGEGRRAAQRAALKEMERLQTSTKHGWAQVNAGKRQAEERAARAEAALDDLAGEVGEVVEVVGEVLAGVA